MSMPPGLDVSFYVPSNQAQTSQLSRFSNQKPKVPIEGRVSFFLSFERQYQILQLPERNDSIFQVDGVIADVVDCCIAYAIDKLVWDFKKSFKLLRRGTFEEDS
jgi:hypothetical protein